ncbi:MAG TPA: hypothetical protein VHF25_14395, partial [Nitriliruptorales bacterium]|nr:hypothetical protein [Nitriliruptorales bacterium]
ETVVDRSLRVTSERGDALLRIVAVGRHRLGGRQQRPLQLHLRGRLGPLSAQFRDLLFQRFFTAKQEFADAGSVEDLERLLRRVRRQVEVTSELAARQARQVVGAIVERLQADLGSDAGAVLAGIGVALPQPSTRPLEQHVDPHHAFNPELGGAAVGGVVGGLGLAVLGVTLGPIGLIGGALVGWRLGGVLRSGRTLVQARALAVERLDGLLDAIANEFDRHLAVQTEAVRAAVAERYTALTADLAAQVAAVEHLMAHPELVSARNAECDRILAVLRDLTDAVSAIGGSVRPEAVTA